MSEVRHDSPEAAAAFLAENPGSATAAETNTTYRVCLGPSDKGWFVLSWSAAAIGKYDWVGLYANASDPDTEYVTGNNWQWASEGSSYTTSTAVQPGYQARYLVWSDTDKAYTSVARTPGYPANICSS